ncbi:Protein SQS1 [Paramyrothecium foliicola]|nr:Protein SQS1 [Paramyrothecium foliicola]
MTFGGFTLADEARQTSQRDHSFWASSNSLRSKPVSFISAGTSEPLKQLEDLVVQTTLDNQNGSKSRAVIEEVSQEAQSSQTTSSPTVQGLQEVIISENSESLSNEPVMQVTPDDIEAPVAQQQPLFVIDVTGEAPLDPSDRYVPNPTQAPSQSISSSDDEVILFKGRNGRRQRDNPSQISLAQIHTEIQVVEEEMLKPTETLHVGHTERRQSRGSSRSKKISRSGKDEEDALIADYIANMRENGETDDFILQATYSGRDLGGTDNDVASDSGLSDKGHNRENASNHHGMAGQKPRDTTLSTGETTTLPSDVYRSESELDDDTLKQLLAGHDPTMGPSAMFGPDDSDSSDSDSSDDSPTHETVAQVEDFDFMDWQRPSVRRRKAKGARSQISFGVSDSELEQTMQAAWKNDRLKKSQRKKQREELRALGLLGQTKPGDLRVKYPKGMSLEEVSEEMRSFLQSAQETLTLPPMDTHARKMIHELANKFNIKSKSTGKAEQRRPALYRTLRTLPYVESTFDQAVSRIKRRYFPRQDLKGKVKHGPRLPPARTNHAAATYRDGEVVGAAAPELGSENRGRAMLEKMGWSNGTALGATHNKGILQPVTHTMKRSKAGLA